MNSDRLIRVVFFLSVFFAHHALQAYAWRMHIAEMADPQVFDEPWAILSLPLFAVVPRHLQPIHFETLLFTNSLLWAAAAMWLLTLLPVRRVLRRWTRVRTGALPMYVAGHEPPPATNQTSGGADRSSESGRRHWSARPGTRTLGNGRYELIACIGSGAFATVYRARDHVRGLDVAIKTLNAEAVAPQDRERFRAAFQQEASLAGRLDHHGIVAVFDHDAAAKEPYIVMSLIKGGTLRARLDALPPGKHLGWLEVVEIGEQVAAALEYAGRQGVKAHRDIKPANIFRGDSGYKVGDFGIVSRHAGERQPPPVPAGGTPGYMAPEQLLAPQTVDWRADLFSLCIVLYECLAGALPYANFSVVRPSTTPAAIESIVAAANADLRSLREQTPNIPAHVAAAIERGLRFDRTERFTSWDEFARALRGEPLRY